LNDRPFEIFLVSGRNGECRYTMMAALGIQISERLKRGATLAEIADDLAGISCLNRSNGVETKGQPAFSCADAIARVLRGDIPPATKSDPNCDRLRLFGPETCQTCGHGISWGPKGDCKERQNPL
jgi:hypothetical protein